MINIDDYKDEHGRIDWDAYDKANEDAGEKCYQCKHYIITPWDKTPIRRRCASCANLDLEEEADHNSLIRCPYCRHTEDAETLLDHHDYGLFDESVETTCDNCGADYTIQIHTSVSYTSPPLAKPDEED